MSFTTGKTAFLNCPFTQAIGMKNQQSLKWFHNRTRVTKKHHNQRIHWTEDGVIIVDLKLVDAGKYEVYVGQQILCRFQLQVDQGNIV